MVISVVLGVLDVCAEAVTVTVFSEAGAAAVTVTVFWPAAAGTLDAGMFDVGMLDEPGAAAEEATAAPLADGTEPG